MMEENLSYKNTITTSEKPFDSFQEEKKSIPVIEEQIVIDKDIVESGKVFIKKRVKEEDVHVDVPVLHEEIEVERIKVNKFVEKTPDIRYEGDTMIIPVVEEVAVVEKRLVVVEELHIKKRGIETKIPYDLKLKKEEVDVMRSSNVENKA